jgi:hypothetical protein
MLLRVVAREAAALTSLSLFLSMILVWSQVLGNL